MNLTASTHALTLLGGGQLAMMLLEAASSLELAALVFGQSDTEPAAQWISAQKNSPHAFVKSVLGADPSRNWLGPRSGVLSFENEFVDLQKLYSIVPNELRIRPSLHCLSVLQNKYFQKLLFQNCGVKTAEFGDDLLRVPQNVVLKWKRGGYDGKGVLLDPNQDSAATENFKARATHGVFWEKKIPFESELAIQGCFTSGRGFCFPLVKVSAVNGVCFEVRSVENHPLESEAKRSLEKLAATLAYTGVMAMEFFESEGQLLANEVAPRVHNTGHHTLQSANLSQFEAHLRAISDLPIGELKVQPHFGMINWLGHLAQNLPPVGDLRNEKLKGLKDLGPGIEFKDYFKTEMRSARKMGHWTWVAETAEASHQYRERILGGLLKWQKESV